MNNEERGEEPQRIVIDANVVIAVWHKRDQYNEKAIQILKKIAEGKIHEGYISNYVLVEVINFLMRKVPFEDVMAALDFLKKTDRLKIVYIDRLLEEEIEEVTKRYKKFTLTDSSLIVLARELKSPIYSFDKEFDEIEGIERREE